MKFPENMDAIFDQVRKMQENVEKVQIDLDQQEVEASSGGGMVTVKVNGSQLITALRIDKTVVNPEDVEMLQDLVQAAVNEAMRKSRDLMKQEFMKLTGRLPIPGFN